jgi:Sulfotransferase family
VTKTLPNALIIGAPRCGTTSVHAHLALHPDVYVGTTKEPQFFSSEAAEIRLDGPNDRQALSHLVTNLEDYERLFEGFDGQRVVTEASTTYIYFPGTARAIRQRIPDCKIVAILRDPVARAYSDFLRQRRNGEEPLADFGEALREEDRRIASGWAYRWHYRSRSLYSDRLQEYFEEFPSEVVKVFLFEELDDPARFIVELSEFLGIEPRPDIGLGRLNPGGELRSRVLHRTAFGMNPAGRALRRLLPGRVLRRGRQFALKTNVRVPELDPNLVTSLRSGFRPDIERVQALIDRDLGHWLGAPEG